MENLLDAILKDTFTQTQLKHRLRILKSYLTQYLFRSEHKTESLATADLEWLRSLPESFYKNFNKDNVYNNLAELDKKLTSLTPLILYLSFEPDLPTISSIGNFIRRTFSNSTFLLDIKYDPYLIAGCALSWKGVYKDYSLKMRIEERKEEILESFKKYLR